MPAETTAGGSSGLPAGALRHVLLLIGQTASETTSVIGAGRATTDAVAAPTSTHADRTSGQKGSGAALAGGLGNAPTLAHAVMVEASLLAMVFSGRSALPDVVGPATYRSPISLTERLEAGIAGCLRAVGPTSSRRPVTRSGRPEKRLATPRQGGSRTKTAFPKRHTASPSKVAYLKTRLAVFATASSIFISKTAIAARTAISPRLTATVTTAL